MCKQLQERFIPIALVSSRLALSKENLNFARTSLFGQLTRRRQSDRQSLLSSSSPFGFTLRHLEEIKHAHITRHKIYTHSEICSFFYIINTHHFILSLGPEEKVELFSTSPISSRQKLKLLMVHMQENFTTFTCTHKFIYVNKVIRLVPEHQISEMI